MTNISEIYDVIRRLRGKAKQGFVRPTIEQFFKSSVDYGDIESGPNPEYLAKITAPDGAAQDYFGRSVAVSDTAIVVGSHYDDDNGDISGSAYIFNTDGTYVTKITAPDGAVGDRFSYSVAISDTTIVVGAFYDDDSGDNSGSAYIFNTDGTYVTKITAPDGAAYDRFGISVAISDTAIVVGAYADDDNGTDSGSAYIFNTDGTYVTKITAPDGAGGDVFGSSVAISDTAIVVGASFDDDSGDSSGSAYIFNTDGTYVTKITAPDGAAGDYFGSSVAISDTTIVVGAHYDDDGGADSGSAYIFNTDGTYVTKITAPDAAAGDLFGNSVAVSDTTIVVGVYRDDTNGTDSGAVYIFNIDGTYVTKITAPDAAAGDLFGVSVAVSDTTIVVGALYADDNGDASGSAYIFTI
jgi:predicted amidohydrolase